ncbi:helix-turn-helix transcriptional regulator [Gordonibacter sp. 28C]|uniref:helix-turn-helix transcriptional regulator n=1 Tax=Gordonibacter sp. 28C TaxID=2078569 RepID=UPI001314D364|nr:helix-turn-helix transcriptional regulator [Gordonibacter sp. 28C]
MCLLVASAIAMPPLLDVFLLACFAGGFAVAAFLLSLPSLAQVLTDIERTCPMACGLCFGVLMAALLVSLRMMPGNLAVAAISAALSGALSWTVIVAMLFLSDVLSGPMRVHGVAAAFSLATCFALMAVEQVVVPFVILAFVGAVLLSAELAEAKDIEADEDKPLVNIFARFNKRAPFANALYGIVFGMTASFSLKYEANGLVVVALLALGVVLAGLLPRKSNDKLVNEAVVLVAAGCFLCIMVEPEFLAPVANGVLLGLFGFYFLRNLGWAFGQCVKIGNLDTPVISRALLPLLAGFFAGSLVALGLAVGGSQDLVVYADAAVVLVLVVSAVFFTPSLATPFAREDGEGNAGKGVPVGVPDKGPDALLRRQCDIVRGECGLTEREAEILFLLCKGRTAEYIGKQLFISRNTARVHIYHVYNKTDIHAQQKLIDYVSSIEAD